MHFNCEDNEYLKLQLKAQNTKTIRTLSCAVKVNGSRAEALVDTRQVLPVERKYF